MRSESEQYLSGTMDDKMLDKAVGRLAPSGGTIHILRKCRAIATNSIMFYIFMTVSAYSGRSKQLPYDVVEHYTIQSAAHIDPPFGTDKSVPYEWTEHFTIQPTVA